MIITVKLNTDEAAVVLKALSNALRIQEATSARVTQVDAAVKANRQTQILSAAYHQVRSQIQAQVDKAMATPSLRVRP